MDKFVKIAIACMLILLIMKAFPSETPVSGYKTNTLAPDTVDYLKSSAQYAPYYNAGKKFAVYYTGMDCPHGEAFATIVDAIAANPKHQKNYNFCATVISGNTLQKQFATVEEAQKEGKFMDKCQQFCIVNPKNGGIYSLNRADEKEAQDLPHLFTTLKDW